MRNQIRGVDIEHALGVVGLFLAILLARLADRGYSEHVTLANRATGFLARRGIDGIAVIGWLADRLPQPSARKARKGGCDEQTTGLRLWARGL